MTPAAPVTPRERYAIRLMVEPLRSALRADTVRVDKLGHAVIRRRFKLGQEDQALSWPDHVVSVLPPGDSGGAYGVRELRDAKGYRVIEVKVRPERR